jgi:prophage regulatory protein
VRRNAARRASDLPQGKLKGFLFHEILIFWPDCGGCEDLSSQKYGVSLWMIALTVWTESETRVTLPLASHIGPLRTARVGGGREKLDRTNPCQGQCGPLGLNPRSARSGPSLTGDPGAVKEFSGRRLVYRFDEINLVMPQNDTDVGDRPSAKIPPLPQTGFLRLPSILGPAGPIPVSRSTWWAGVKEGRFPKPVKLGPRITAWRVEDIRALIENGG